MRKLAIVAATAGLLGLGLPVARADTKDAGKPAAGKARAEGQGYVVEVQPPASVTVGAAAKAQIVLKPTGGYHVNKEFPFVLAVTPPPGVDTPKAKQQNGDATKLEEAGAVFEVPFTASQTGDKAFAASFRFAVCTATTCEPHNEKLAWNVSVK